MAPIRKDDHLVEPHDDADDDPPRSLFAAKWFRVVLVFLIVGVIAAIAVPYVIDHLNPPTKPSVVGKAPAPAPPLASAPATTTSPSVPATPPPSTITGAPATAVPARPTPKSPATTGESAGPSGKRAQSGAKLAAKPSNSVRGAYWVQVGAFRDPERAKRLAATLRQQNFNVTDTTTAGAQAGGGPAAAVDHYDVHVAGIAPATLTAKLSARGLSADPTSDGVVIRPSLVLRDAVALSKELAVDGLKVQVKRARGASGDASPPASADAARPLHRVRVGPFDDREAALTALRDLEAKGFKPYIARARQ